MRCVSQNLSDLQRKEFNNQSLKGMRATLYTVTTTEDADGNRVKEVNSKRYGMPCVIKLTNNFAAGLMEVIKIGS